MRGLIRRAVLVAGAAAVLLGSAAGVASAGANPVLSWAPTTSLGTFNYGTLNASQTASQAFTLANSGGNATSALKITLTGSAAFSKTADTCTGTSLGPRKTCSVTVAYAPASSGQSDSATLTATSNKPAATASLTLKGASAKSSPGIATTPSAGGTIGSTTVNDTATLSGGVSPTGTIEFKLFGPSMTADCTGTPVFDQTVAVAGDGSYVSGSFTPGQAGTYWWTASYSGDTHNNPAATSCGDESVTISKASPAVSTSFVPGPFPFGTIVADAATLSGGVSPTGTIEFKLFGPSATADCTGTPVFDHTIAVIGDGTYGPVFFTPVQAGTYWWTASYSGDTNNNPAATNCGDESVTISKISPAVSTSASPGGPAGSTAVSDTATLSGGVSPTGTIEFKLYGPSATADCTGTPVFDQTVAVAGDGSYVSGSFTPGQAGTYWWTASYSGDGNNNPAATNCGDESVTISKASPTLTTSPAPSSGPPGTFVSDFATLSGGASPTGTIEFKLYGPSATADCTGTPLAVIDVGVLGNGKYFSGNQVTLNQAGTWWWTASYGGDGNNNPAATSCGDESVIIS